MAGKKQRHDDIAKIARNLQPQKQTFRQFLKTPAGTALQKEVFEISPAVISQKLTERFCNLEGNLAVSRERYLRSIIREVYPHVSVPWDPANDELDALTVQEIIGVQLGPEPKRVDARITYPSIVQGGKTQHKDSSGQTTKAGPSGTQGVPQLAGTEVRELSDENSAITFEEVQEANDVVRNTNMVQREELTGLTKGNFADDIISKFISRKAGMPYGQTQIREATRVVLNYNTGMQPWSDVLRMGPSPTIPFGNTNKDFWSMASSLETLPTEIDIDEQTANDAALARQIQEEEEFEEGQRLAREARDSVVIETPTRTSKGRKEVPSLQLEGEGSETPLATEIKATSTQHGNKRQLQTTKKDKGDKKKSSRDSRTTSKNSQSRSSSRSRSRSRSGSHSLECNPSKKTSRGHKSNRRVSKSRSSSASRSHTSVRTRTSTKSHKPFRKVSRSPCRSPSRSRSRSRSRSP